MQKKRRKNVLSRYTLCLACISLHKIDISCCVYKLESTITKWQKKKKIGYNIDECHLQEK